MIRYLPSPADIEQITGVDPESEEELILSTSKEESFVGLAFKVLSDPYVGKMTLVRVYAGQADQIREV